VLTPKTGEDAEVVNKQLNSKYVYVHTHGTGWPPFTALEQWKASRHRCG